MLGEKAISHPVAGPVQYTTMYVDDMENRSHACPAEATAFIGEMTSNGESIEDISESVDELREKLANMRRLMEERKGSTLGEISDRKRRRQNAEVIDGNFLSWIFGTVLAVILTVSCYAFYNLYHAVLKKFPSKHTEL